MQPTDSRDASFSPYHDDDHLSDFLDDDARRFTTNAAIVFTIHIGLVFALSGSFIVPDLKPPPPPEAVTVEIVTFDPAPEPEVKPEPEAAPIIVEPKPTPPPPAPVPKPQPRPAPEPEPVPPPPRPEPEPIVEPEPIPEPEPLIAPPPPPEILVQSEPEPLDPVIPEPLPSPEPTPEPEPEPEPEPIIEFFEPIPEPEFDPIIEIFEPLPEAVLDPEPLPDPIIEPDAELEPLPVVPDLPPTPGVIEAETLPEILDPEPLPLEVIIEPEPEVLPEPITPDPVVIEPEPEPEPETRPEPEVIPLAPTVLASPDAPETREEEVRAVPQEQSDPFLDLLKKDRDTSLNDPIIPPVRGGGNQGPISLGGNPPGTVSAPPGGGTQINRTNPGAGGWTLAPQGPEPSAAMKGINLDIRCREEGRTHEDCPDYLQKNRGRDRTGRESFNGHAGTGADRGNRISESRSIPTRSELGLDIGNNSVNSGGPSTSVLDFQDTNFDREFLNKPLNLGPGPKRLRDALTPDGPPPPVNNWTLETPSAQPDSENDDVLNWVLDKSPDE